MTFPRTMKLHPLLGLYLLFLGSPCNPLLAQENAPTQTAQASESCKIPLKFVPSRIMAWWLDPEHNERPLEYGGGWQSNPYVGIGPVWRTTVDIQGLERIESLEPQNELLVTGEKMSIERLRSRIEVLDKPLRYIELEMRTVSVSGKDADKFVSDDRAPLATVGRIGKGDVEGLLRVLQQNHKANIQTTIHAKAIDEGWAPLTYSENVKATLSNGEALTIHASETLNVVPTLDLSNTIKLRLWWTDSATLGTPDPTPQKLEAESLGSIVPVADGQTFAIADMNSLLSPQFASNPERQNEQVLVHLVTVRIARTP